MSTKRSAKSECFGEATIRRVLAGFDLVPSAELVRQIQVYARLLRKWNEKINLTSIVDPHQVLQRHFGECLWGARFVPEGAQDLVDIGSGAGFPGLVLKLARPDLKVTLVEPVLKKVAFLREVARELGVSVQVLTNRTEGMADRAAKADVITTRAVRPDRSLIEWSARALREGGRMVLWTSAAESVKAMRFAVFQWKEGGRIPGADERMVLVGIR
jgi:16S rRNA (guanine527-N7)-methyltransferase